MLPATDAPVGISCTWPATKDELIDYSIRSGAPIEVVENLQELEDEGEIYEGLDDIWPDYPSQEDFFFNEDEYWSLINRLYQITLIKEGCPLKQPSSVYKISEIQTTI